MRITVSEERGLETVTATIICMRICHGPHSVVSTQKTAQFVSTFLPKTHLVASTE